MKLSQKQIKDVSDLLAAGIKEKYVDSDYINQIERLKINPEVLQPILQYLLYNYNEILKYIDLSAVSFNNIHIQGKNLEGTNADIDPQTIYKKFLYETNLKNVDMSGKDFTGVDVRYANLEGTNANIDPQTVYNRSLIYTNLKNVDMSGKDFTGVNVAGANLEGTSAKIDLLNIDNRDIRGTNLNGCILSENIDFKFLKTNDDTQFKNAIFVGELDDSLKKYIKSLF